MWHPKLSQFIWMSLQIEIFLRLEFILSEIETHLILLQFYKHTHINMQDLTYQFQMCELIHFRFFPLTPQRRFLNLEVITSSTWVSWRTIGVKNVLKKHFLTVLKKVLFCIFLLNSIF